MNKRNTLSIAPYFGGKGRMAHFIADRLNYDDSDIFVTPFGGMCRVLLNKPRHRVECYNDYSSGLTALMRILSDPVKSVEFIHRLDDETSYSEEEFNRQKIIFDSAEKDLVEQEYEKLRRILIDRYKDKNKEEKIVAVHNARKYLDKLLYQVLLKKNVSLAQKFIADRKISSSIDTSKLKQELQEDENYKSHLDNWVALYEFKIERGFIERTADIDGTVDDEMELAIATFVVFSQSRDGMGQAFSKEKFDSNDQYKKRIVNLFDCAERLEGVEIFQIDAVDFFRRMMFVDVGTPLDEIPPQFSIMNEWINNPRVMMYCDPSYISPKSEERLLEGIDIDSVDSLWGAIEERYKGKKQPENLGKIYAMSFGYDEQEKFLRCIQNARCKILVSNYDLKLYNKYLNESTGWHREEFHTSTAVGGKKDNKRVEVIWYNY